MANWLDYVCEIDYAKGTGEVASCVGFQLCFFVAISIEFVCWTCWLRHCSQSSSVQLHCSMSCSKLLADGSIWRADEVGAAAAAAAAAGKPAGNRIPATFDDVSSRVFN